LTTNTAQDAFNSLGSAFFDDQAGTLLERCVDVGCGQNVAYIGRGDRLGYFDVDFGETPSVSVETRIASGSTTTGTIQYRLNWIDGPVIAEVPVPNTGAWQNWQNVRVPTTGITGEHRVYQTFVSSSGDDFVNVNWFRFHRS
jgi:beta-glucosidase